MGNGFKRKWKKREKTQKAKYEELFCKGAQVNGTIARKGGRIKRDF